jgi:hypothetical protein
VTSIASGNPAGVQDALAGTLSSLVGVAANISNPDAATASVQGAVTALLGGDQQAAVAHLSDLVGQLVGVTGGVVPPGVTAGVQAAVTALLAGDAAGALNGLGAAVGAAVAAAPASGSGGDGSIANFDLPDATGAVGSAVGPVLGGHGDLAPGRLFFVVSGAHAASTGPRLVVRGARLVQHGSRVRVKVACIGQSSQTCSGVVKIRQVNKVIAHSTQLRMAGGKTTKILLKVAGKHKKASAKKTARH